MNVLVLLLATTVPVVQAQGGQTEAATEMEYAAILPTVVVEGTADTSTTKGYIGYQNASVTRDGLSVKETPRTIDVLNIQKNKNYGTNDLSSILEGNAGIDTGYDMRGENLYLRGFNIDANDIYRDGVRESGQVRRSTANIERVEILKGPASVLYGRTSGGGIVNMVSKSANFTTNRNVGAALGSWHNHSLSADINQVVSQNLAVRLNAEVSKANSFRSGIETESQMISPSIAFRSDDGRLRWTGQYTYDKVERVPDRGPERAEYKKMGISYRTGFARPGDFVTDRLEVWRSDLQYRLSDNWRLDWKLAHRTASQDFDHYFGGTYNPRTRTLAQSYAWQETGNKTLSNSLTLNGLLTTGSIDHNLTFGWDVSREERHPILAVLRNQNINPFDSSTWTRRSVRPAATIDNDHRAHAHGFFVQDTMALTPTDIRKRYREYRGDSFSPSLGVVWDVNPAHTLYASYNKSFSPYGGRSLLGVSTSSTAVFDSEPQYSRQYEAGVKSDWLNKTLNTTLSVYRLEHYNIRYQPDAINRPEDWRVRGKERSQGVELSAIGAITRNWYLRGSMGWMSARIVEDVSDPAAVGRRLNNTARFNGNLFVRYAPDERFYGEVGITRVGSRFYQSGNAGYSLPGFNRIDAMIGYNHKAFNVTLGVFNALDKEYWRSSAMPGSPRAYTLRFNYRL